MARYYANYGCLMAIDRGKVKFPSRLGFISLCIGLVGILTTSNQITQTNREAYIHGLADVATITCGQIDALNDFFKSNASRDGCENDGGKQARYNAQDKIPTLEKLRLGSIFLVLWGIIFIVTFKFFKLPLKSRTSGENKSSQISDQLTTLKKLRDDQLISDSEYEKLRLKALGEM